MKGSISSALGLDSPLSPGLLQSSPVAMLMVTQASYTSPSSPVLESSKTPEW